MNQENNNFSIEKCNHCALRTLETNKKHTPLYGSGGNVIMVIDVKPGPIESFKKFLTTLNWPVDKTYFTSLLKCDCNEFDFINAEACYKHWLAQEIAMTNPLAIITLGSFVDNFIKSKNQNYTMYNLPHYLYIKSNVHLKDEWAKEIRVIFDTIKQTTRDMMAVC